MSENQRNSRNTVLLKTIKVMKNKRRLRNRQCFFLFLKQKKDINKKENPNTVWCSVGCKIASA
jgi:hypothetical protein